jgi:antitoxin ParD1/3/4
MTITLTPELEQFIAERMNKEGYSSPEKVLEEGCRLIQAKEEYERRREELRHELQIGIDEINRGEVLNGDEVFDQILAENQKRPRAKT